jgi:hypothetical protein
MTPITARSHARRAATTYQVHYRNHEEDEPEVARRPHGDAPCRQLREELTPQATRARPWRERDRAHAANARARTIGLFSFDTTREFTQRTLSSSSESSPSSPGRCAVPARSATPPAPAAARGAPTPVLTVLARCRTISPFTIMGTRCCARQQQQHIPVPHVAEQQPWADAAASPLNRCSL